MSGPLVLKNGTIYDPANGVSGVVRDLWIDGGVFVAEPAESEKHRYPAIDLSGTVVMAGGVDMHAHIAGPKVNYARKLRPEDRRTEPVAADGIMRSGTRGSTPTTFVTGHLYAGMGYTTVFDAAVPPLGARHAHEEFHDTPVIDKGFLVLGGNHLYALERVAENDQAGLTQFVAWLLRATRGYGLKVVNPGGVEMWKHGAEHTTGLDTRVEPFDLTPRRIVSMMARAADELALPHPMHLHCNRLGLAGNSSTTLETMRALEGARSHMTHVQFHSYGGEPGDGFSFRSAVPELADYVNSHPEITVDIGQVMFGKTTSMTGDGPLGHYLHKVVGGKWFNSETELEAGCGIVPVAYKQKSLIHAVQWAAGLEWFLLVKNPWQVALSTDHPNGAAFAAYPEIMALLMSRDLRRECLKQLPEKVLARTTLADLDREYSLDEIAIVTRAAPARMLGLGRKGQLGVGADADVAAYDPGPDRKRMFEMPRLVLKGGRVVIDRGEVRSLPFGPTLTYSPPVDADQWRRIAAWTDRYSSLRHDSFLVGAEYLSRGETPIAVSAVQ